MDNLSVIDSAWMELDKLESAATALFTGTWHEEDSPESLVTETRDNPGISGDHDVTNDGDEPTNGGDTCAISRILLQLEQFEAGLTELLEPDSNDREIRAEDDTDDVAEEQTADGSSERSEAESCSERQHAGSSSEKHETESNTEKHETDSNSLRQDMGSRSEGPQSGSQTRRKRQRVLFSHQQRAALEDRFHQKGYLTVRERKELASDLGLSESQVLSWYRNRNRLIRHGAYDGAYEVQQAQRPGLTTRRHQLYHVTSQTPSAPTMDRVSREETSLQGTEMNKSSSAGTANSCIDYSHKRALRGVTRIRNAPQTRSVLRNAPHSSYGATSDVAYSNVYQPLIAHHASSMYTDYYRNWFRHYHHPGLYSNHLQPHYDYTPYIPYLCQEEHAHNGDSYRSATCHSVQEPAFRSLVTSDCMYSAYPTRNPEA